MMAVFKPFIQPNTLDQLFKDVKDAGETAVLERLVKMAPPPADTV